MTKEITPQEALDEINRLNRERDALKQQLATAERVIEFKDKVITAIETRAEEAEARADAAEKKLAELIDTYTAEAGAHLRSEQQLADQRDTAESAAQRMREALERLEWIPDDDSSPYCPWCANWQKSGHISDCIIPAALRDDAREGGGE